MAREEHPSPAVVARARSAGPRGPQWRAILEARWQARLAEVTELSLAYHGAAAAPDDRGDGAGQRKARRLLRRTVTVRRKLADVEDALARLAAGTFGHCEQCGSAIPATVLTLAPEARYCLRCADEPDEPVPAKRPAVAGRPTDDGTDLGVDLFTSNAFAVLSLRALSFLLASSADRFRYLKQGLTVLLMFIGVKMLISPVAHVPVTVSLIVIVGCAVAASLWRDRAFPRPANEPKRPAAR